MVCGIVGDGSAFDTYEEFVSLVIENDNEPSEVAASNETPEPDSESVQNTKSEHINNESPENPDNADSQTQAPPTPSDESTTVEPQEQLAPRRSGRIRGQVSEWWKAMFWSQRIPQINIDR